MENNMNNKVFVGSKYFRYGKEGNLILVRVVRYQNVDTVVIKHKECDYTEKISISELIENYTLLNPDGYIFFNIVKINESKLDDVIVALYRKEDINALEPLPYCVCRQGITDIFANQIKINNKTYYGACVSKDTIPVDVPFEVMLACDGVSSNESIAVYIDDKYDDIIGMIKTKKYDSVLLGLFNDYINYTAKSTGFGSIYANNAKKLDCVDGYCKKLTDLLQYNNFMYDFYRAYNIIPVVFDIDVDKEKGNTLDNIPDLKITLENLLCCYIDDSIIIKYDKDIDLDSIKSKYILVSDNKEELYIVAYIPSETRKYYIDPDDVKEGIDKHHSMTSDDVKGSYGNIRMSKKKYN